MRFSPPQERILKLLEDGLPHTRKEVRDQLQDSQATYQNLAKHMMFIRAKLRMLGQDIVTELSGRAIYYRHVRFLAGASPVTEQELPVKRE